MTPTQTLFTPTHRPDGLFALGESIQHQLTDNPELSVEWLIIPNNGGTVPAKIAQMPFARILEAPEELGTSVGALKRFACQNALGSILAECDHDDVLLPGCLTAVQKALGDGGCKFFYSGTYETKPDGEPHLYGEAFGWRHAEYEGMKYNVPFPASARSLCEIFYAPNHIRAWTREAYEKAGGHDPKLDVCDDQDLIARTYLAGAEFVCDSRPLYWQKGTGKNTQLERNAKIQVMQANIRSKYLEPLSLEWAKRNNLLCLDFGGAHSCPAGYTPVDRYPVKGGIQADLAWNVPFEDKGVGVIRAQDFIEHIPLGRVVPLMNEIYRVLAHGGFFLSSTPSTDGRGAFCDPTHVSFHNQLSWRYYTNKNFSAYVPDIKCKFQALEVETLYPSDWHREQNLPYVVANLVADHGGRLPGLKQI